jgi:hypothetical protein
MLVDFENTGFINVHPSLCEEKNTYIPWGFIKGDISEQSDLMELLTTIESGLTAEQIALLVNADDKLYELLTAIAELEQKNLADMTEINAVLDIKADADAVYTKEEVDNLFDNIKVDVDLTGYATEGWVKEQGYLTEHQSLANYYTKSEVDSAVNNKVDINKIWSGTQAEWDALSAEQQNSYTIAMIEK